MRTPKHNSTSFWKPTEQPKEHIRKLDDVSAEQSLHKPMCERIAEYYNEYFASEPVTVEHYRTMKYKIVIYYIYNKLFEKVGEYTMYYAIFQLAKSNQPYYIVRRGFTIHQQPIKKVA